MQRVREQVGFFSGNDPERGEGITIGVLDTGVGYHPDLAGKILSFRDFVGGRNLMYDNNGHGTHVCGILSGSGGLSEGRYRGMAPGAKLVVGKVLDERGDGSTEGMLAGLDWILQVRERPRRGPCRRKLNSYVIMGFWWYVRRETRAPETIQSLQWEEAVGW